MNGLLWLGVLLALSAAPLVLAFPYLSKRRPEFGRSRLLLASIAGLAAVVPATIVQAFTPRTTPGAINLLLHAFVFIALTEEGAKYLLLRWTRKTWGAEKNGVPAGIAASLGFAFFETVVYASANPSAALVRAVTAAPLHAACGAWVGRAAIGRRSMPILAALDLAFAVFVHGAYDLTLLVPGFPVGVPILIALLGLVTALKTLHEDGEN